MSSDPGQPQRHALGVDFGTSNTVAVARWPDGRARPILIDGSPLLPSAVYAEPDGQLIVGRDAVHSARLDPARFEPNPKRRIDDRTVLLGDREIPVIDLMSAVLARVAEEWHRAVGPVRPTVTLTCPATWGSTRRTMLADAAASAGLEGARLVAEPVAAATYFAQVIGREVSIGSAVVVHDFGAGTFDASVVARTEDGFEVLAVDGRDDIGGLDVDAAVVEHFGRTCGERDPEAWQRLSFPTTVEERRAQRQLWDDVRVAKERLSRTQSADLVIPLLELEVHLTRDELERLAEPVIAATVAVTQGVMREADLPKDRLAGVFLVGGASRIPLVATMLHRALDEPPVVIEQPELVVAEGSILAEAALLTAGPSATALTSEMRLVGRSGATAPVSPAGTAVTTSDESVEPSSAALSAPTEQMAGAAARPVDEAWPARRWDEAAALRLHEELWPGGQPSDEPPSDMPPAVDPWPHARNDQWVDDPHGTVVNERWEPPTPTPTATPVSGSPVSGSQAAGAAVPTQPVRASVAVRPPPPKPVKQAKQPRPARAPQPSRPAKVRPVRPRRTGGFLRFLQILMSVVVLIAVPTAAAVAAYGYGNALPLEQDAINLGRDLLRMIRGS
jgi:molecular chaperone DnaK